MPKPALNPLRIIALGTIMAAALVMVPSSAQADDTALLGPQTTIGSGSSTADSSALQPAGTSPLQSTTDDSNGLAAPVQNALQAPATGSDSLQVLGNEADGAPHQLADASSTMPWPGWGLVVIGALLLAFIAQVMRDRRRFRHHVL